MPMKSVSHPSVMCVLCSSGFSGESAFASGVLSFSKPFFPVRTAVCSIAIFRFSLLYRLNIGKRRSSAPFSARSISLCLKS